VWYFTTDVIALYLARNYEIVGEHKMSHCNTLAQCVTHDMQQGSVIS